MNGDPMNEQPIPSLPTTSAAVLPPAPRRRRWVSILLTLVIFLAGLVLGTGLGVVGTLKRIDWLRQHPEQGTARMAAKIGSQLKLTPVQVEQVKGILNKRVAAFEAIRRDVRPRMNAELDLVEKEVAGLLDAQRAERWHTLFAQYRKTWSPPLGGGGK